MKRIEQLPMPPTSGVLGHVSYLKKSNVHQQMLCWIKEYGAHFRLKLGMKDVLVLSDAAQIKSVLKSRPDEFRRLKNIESVFDEIGLNGVFSAEEERWKHQRKLTEPMFQPSHLKHFHPQLSVIAERLGKHLEMLAESGEVVELVAEFKKYTVDVTSLLAFGEDFNSIEQTTVPLSKSLQNVFPVINQRCSSPIPLWRFFKTKKDKLFDTSLEDIGHFVYGCIEKQRARLVHEPALKDSPENMLQIMLLEQEQDSSLTDQDIVANAITLLLAGEDTTANTLAWMAFLVSGNRSSELALQDELDALGKRKVLEWPLPRTPYMTAVMYEAMRLKPVAPQLYLEPTRDTQIGDIEVKKGTPVFVMLHANGFDPDLFEDPTTFNPNRWVEKDGASFSNLQPFGGGARLCPGRSLAMMEIKLAFHTLFKEFSIEPQQAPETVVEQFAFTMSPVGFNVKITKRS
ncbi:MULTISPECIES: cytochrome P450 [Vibrio]|uniref:cytochrome P450 n=1 Tax=Vibrio TaxID=662 RepID=UPI0002E72A83|nr:cytochrome P450 [Vibrio tasmaniensis]OEF80648.1 cytochrome P450 [Vibrio tasmaniensis 1F-155]PMO81962.1 cytochrome P450 [Vibrio tasmaniensis]